MRFPAALSSRSFFWAARCRSGLNCRTWSLDQTVWVVESEKDWIDTYPIVSSIDTIVYRLQMTRPAISPVRAISATALGWEPSVDLREGIGVPSPILSACWLPPAASTPMKPETTATMVEARRAAITLSDVVRVGERRCALTTTSAAPTPSATTATVSHSRTPAESGLARHCMAPAPSVSAIRRNPRPSGVGSKSRNYAARDR